MAIQVGVLKETAEFEKRVAASPESVKKLIALGCSVSIQSGAGDSAHFTDDAFKAAGAKLVKSAAEIIKNSDIILCVQSPDESLIKVSKKGTCLIGILAPHSNSDALNLYSKQGLIAFSMELIPRITRAQSMDVLSSQANLAGYKSVLDATAEFGRAIPMMMTAAGTIPPAKTFVMGAGVAGLQAIATARRLGAIVTATDVRPAAKEQVESLGASFIAVENEEFKQAETAGGYAKEMSDDYKKRQAALIEDHIARQDIVITTALIPGRKAPKLITAGMVKSMKPGSVIVDLAVESGGNCAGSISGSIVQEKGVTIIGHANVPSRLARDASALYAKNILNFVSLLIEKDRGTLAINWDDEIITGTALTQDGAIVHAQFKDATPSKPATKTASTTPKKAAPAKKKAKPAAPKPKKDTKTTTPARKTPSPSQNKMPKEE